MVARILDMERLCGPDFVVVFFKGKLRNCKPSLQVLSWSQYQTPAGSCIWEYVLDGNFN